MVIYKKNVRETLFSRISVFIVWSDSVSQYPIAAANSIHFRFYYEYTYKLYRMFFFSFFFLNLSYGFCWFLHSNSLLKVSSIALQLYMFRIVLYIIDLTAPQLCNTVSFMFIFLLSFCVQWKHDFKNFLINLIELLVNSIVSAPFICGVRKDRRKQKC